MSRSVHRCPVCNGTGVMPPYVHVARRTAFAGVDSNCASCRGRGVIIVQDQVDAVSTIPVPTVCRSDDDPGFAPNDPIEDFIDAGDAGRRRKTTP